METGADHGHDVEGIERDVAKDRAASIRSEPRLGQIQHEVDMFILAHQ